MTNDPNALYQRAERAFMEGRLDAARADLAATLRLTGDHPAILHLLALVEKRAGRAGPSGDAFRRALRVAPRDPQIRNNYANLLIGQGALDAALVELDHAIAADPGFVDGRINRAIVLQRLGLLADAHTDIAPVAQARPGDARVQTLLGTIAAAADRFDAAATAFDAALAADPARATALAGRARMALERGEGDAEARYAHALTAAPGTPELMLGKALAVEAEGRGSDAILALGAILDAVPDWVDGHRELVRMRGESGEAEEGGDMFDRFRAAAMRPDAPIDLVRSYLAALSQAGRPEILLDHVTTLGPRADADPMIATLRAAALGDLDLPGADEAIARIETLPDGAIMAARHWLRQGHPARAAHLLEPLTALEPDTIDAWAYLGLAWRLTGDPRAQWLHGQPGLFAAIDLPVEPAQLESLSHLLRDLHRSRAHPIGQSLRGGTQTRGNLFARREPSLRSLRDMLETAVAAHMRGLPQHDPAHPLLRYRDRPMRISGSWSVRLSGGGFHVHHIHPAGILSSAAYIALPDWRDEADPQAGWLELGRPPVELGLELPPLAAIEPRPGRLALFPSYLFHGTRPFGSGERLTVAFDVRTD